MKISRRLTKAKWSRLTNVQLKTPPMAPPTTVSTVGLRPSSEASNSATPIAPRTSYQTYPTSRSSSPPSEVRRSRPTPLSASFIEPPQRASSLPMPSSTPRPRLQLPKHSTHLVSSTSNSHHPPPLNNLDSTARRYAGSISRLRFSHTFAAIWTTPELPSKPVSPMGTLPRPFSFNSDSSHPPIN